MFLEQGSSPIANRRPSGFLAAAEQGIVEAQHNLAVMFAKGDGVQRDYVQAANWARRAAEAGHPPAQEDFAYLLEQGKGGPLDYIAAYAWYSAAAARGMRKSAKRIKDLEKIMLPDQIRVAKSRALAFSPAK
jgi:TPR repeat protein